MASDPETGALLRTLAASKPGGRLLEMGTGTGMGTAWLLDGMDAEATLVTVDSSETNTSIARRFLGGDQRLAFHLGDGGEFLEAKRAEGAVYDLIFADTWPGKFECLETTLDLLRPGGLYVVDDLLPQPSWPPNHAEKVAAFLAAIEARPGLRLTRLDWSVGLLVAARSV
jgi:predicted O-methyltransferase YrrM